MMAMGRYRLQNSSNSAVKNIVGQKGILDAHTGKSLCFRMDNGMELRSSAIVDIVVKNLAVEVKTASNSLYTFITEPW